MPTKPPAVYTVYQTTCLANGKIYIGVHKTRDPDDRYLGSGNLISRAVKKYGRDQFQKEVLFIFESRAEAYAKEKELVTAAFAKRADTYNLREGGAIGGWYDGQKGEKNSQHGTVWIWMGGEKPRKVRKEVVGEWMVLGWKRGRGKRCGPPRPSPIKGKVRMSKGSETLYVLPEEVPKWEAQGWRGKQRQNRVWMHPPKGMARKIFESEVQAMLQEGWSLGRRPPKTRQPSSGENHPLAKLTWEKVREIRRIYREGGTTQASLAARFEVSYVAIHHVVRGKTWKES